MVDKTLSDLEIVAVIEDLIKVMHAYFAHSSKKYIEFHYFALLMETKGLKLFKNVCTRWCSLISFLRQVLAKYLAFMAKMYCDKDEKKWYKKAFVSF